MGTLDEAAAELISQTEVFVRAYFAQLPNADPSHDFAHVQRVRRNALQLLRESNEDIPRQTDALVVELAALLHDVGDAKYTEDEGAARRYIDAFLQAQPLLAHDPERREKIIFIMQHVSYRKEQTSTAPPLTLEQHPELCIVQDADRLDAIGAIGIARCFTFGAARLRPFYVHEDMPLPTRTMTSGTGEGDAELAWTDEERHEILVENKGCTLEHFYDKLLHIQSRMKTQRGKELAQDRHQFLLQFLAQWNREMGYAKGPELPEKMK